MYAVLGTSQTIARSFDSSSTSERTISPLETRYEAKEKKKEKEKKEGCSESRACDAALAHRRARASKLRRLRAPTERRGLLRKRRQKQREYLPVAR